MLTYSGCFEHSYGSKKQYRVYTSFCLVEFPSCCGALILHDVNTGWERKFTSSDDYDFGEGVPMVVKAGLTPKIHYTKVLKHILNPPDSAVANLSINSLFRHMKMFSVMHVMCAHDSYEADTSNILGLVKATREKWVIASQQIANRKPGHGNYLFHAMMYLHNARMPQTFEETPPNDDFFIIEEDF